MNALIYTDLLTISSNLFVNILKVSFVFYVCCFFSVAQAKVIYVTYEKTQEVTIRIEGEITSKDLIDFKSALNQLDVSKKTLHMNSVVLKSNGGSGDTAREIGKIIRARKLNTFLAEDSSCASACVPILISGVQRYAFGHVRVHRATFMGESISDAKIPNEVAEAKNATEYYVKLMGISMLLADATENTESWGIRELTEVEKKQWQVFGTDRVTEELLFNQISRSRFMGRKEFIDIFTSQYDDCLEEAKDFKMTVFDCAKTRNLKPLSLVDRTKRSLTTWVLKLDETIPKDISYKEQLQLVNEKLRNGKMYLRYMLINEVADINSATTNSSLKQDSKSVADQMESASIWWVEENKIHVMLKNPTDHNIKRVVFSLSEADCKSAAKKRYMTFELPIALEANKTTVYSGELPFNYTKVYGKGIKCGLIEGTIW